MLFSWKKKQVMPTAADALPGRSQRMTITEPHYVSGHSLVPPFPPGFQQATFALGCFWGAERRFWQIPGVYTTAVGYTGGFTANPTYDEVCGGRTGHAEAVLVVFNPAVVSFASLLSAFWEAHDPTQGMRQGNDVGTQYRSAIYVHSPEQRKLAEASRAAYQQKLAAAKLNDITTDIEDAGEFFYAEDYHQQYLAKNPGGYCGLGGTGVKCPVDIIAPSVAIT